MTTKTVPKPVRISEMMGFPKSADKIPGSEKRNCQPVRVSEIFESLTRSTSRTAERPRKSKFVVPNRGVRRKLYGRSPTPEKPSRRSCYPSQTSDAKLPSKPRPSLFPAVRALTKAQPIQAADNCSPLQDKKSWRKSQLPRRSMLPQPNSIANKFKNNELERKERVLVDKVGMSVLEEDSDETENITPKRMSRSQQDKSPDKLQHEENTSPEVLDYNSKNQNRPTVIKSIVTERLRKIEHDIEDIKSTQKLLLNNQNLLLSRFESLENYINKKNTQVKSAMNGEEEDDDDDAKESKVVAEDKKNDLLEQQEGNDKENVRQSIMACSERRRSARLAAKNDSFTNLEKELNITHSATSKVVVVVDNNNVNENVKTPLKNNIRKKSSKSDKPLREYLAMKAGMSFLETPDANRFKTRIVDDTPLRQKTLRRSISSKVFDELRDLYDSSDSIS